MMIFGSFSRWFRRQKGVSWAVGTLEEVSGVEGDESKSLLGRDSLDTEDQKLCGSPLVGRTLNHDEESWNQVIA
jgi:hypothetical protein